MHIVWDWNGTLFADELAVFEAVNEAAAVIGAGPASLEDYQRMPKRPVPTLYAHILGRPLSDAEWHAVDDAYHGAYASRLEQVRLAPGSREVLAEAARRGCTQSLLSMWPHDELVPLVERADLGTDLAVVAGFEGACGGVKSEHLREHLAVLARELGIAPGDVVVVGDSVDDATAALDNGVRPVLVHSGTYHPEVLERQGVPVATDLADALRAALAPSDPAPSDPAPSDPAPSDLVTGVRHDR